jgi:hypothetical protein
MRSRLLLRGAASYALAALADRAYRLSQRIADFSEGFALGALESEDRSALTARLYARSPHGHRRALFDWEEPWFERSLPPAPARILVGGAGQGREVEHLLERGYGVIAFDVRPTECARAQSFTLGYEELAPALEGEGSPRALEAARAIAEAAPFDAVLLGWLSLSHVTEPIAQDALFSALDRLAPRAPLLASFWMTSMRRMSTSRAHALGAALGERTRARAPTTPLHDVPLRCLPHTGFVYLFDRARLESLARAVHRTFELDETADCPHATFHRARSAS